MVSLCRSGYIAHGVWVPEFILDQPEVLKGLHYQFIHAGTDVTEAFQVLSWNFAHQSMIQCMWAHPWPWTPTHKSPQAKDLTLSHSTVIVQNLWLLLRHI